MANFEEKMGESWVLCQYPLVTIWRNRNKEKQVRDKGIQGAMASRLAISDASVAFVLPQLTPGNRMSPRSAASGVGASRTSLE